MRQSNFDSGYLPGHVKNRGWGSTEYSSLPVTIVADEDFTLRAAVNDKLNIDERRSNICAARNP
jgi:hypothetical protein